jgi:hypothetical protein
VGGSSEASDGWKNYLYEGYLEVIQRGKDTDGDQAEAEVTIAVDPNDSTRYLDYFERSSEIFWITSMIDTVTGYRMRHEPDGWDGRARYMEPPVAGTRVTPSQGGCLWWVERGTRCYVRPRPDVETTLRFSYRILPAPLTDADFNEHPRTPPYYDMAIVFFAAEQYHLMNPVTDISPDGQTLPSEKMRIAGERVMNRKPVPEAEEEKLTTFNVQVRGFRHRPRSRR